MKKDIEMKETGNKVAKTVKCKICDEILGYQKNMKAHLTRKHNHLYRNKAGQISE